MELRHIFGILWRRRWIVINVFLAIFLTIVIGTILITPWYDATAKVLLRKSYASSSLLSSLGLQSGAFTQSAISETDQANYLALTTVRPVIDRVISELNVKRERVRGRIMRTIPFLKSFLRILGVDVESVTEVITAEDLIDSSILSNIFPRPYVSVEQYEQTDILEIKAISPDPEQAMKIANAVAKAFIEEELKRVREDYKGAKDFIDENIIIARDEYKIALKAVKDFKEREKIVNVDTETTELIEKISALKKSMEDNNLLIVKTKASINQIEAQLKSMPKYQKTSEQIKDNEMITSLKLTLRDLYLSLAETKTKYKKNHPFVLDIENKIAQTKELMEKEVEKVFSGETTSIDTVYQDLMEKLVVYYSDIEGYEAQNEAYPKVIKKYESEVMNLPEKLSTYTQLQLLLTVTEDVYDSLLKYQYQIGMAESMALSNIYLVEKAITPDSKDARHRHPPLVINIIIAMLLGTMFGIGATLFIDYLDDSIRTPGDVKAVKGITFLGTIFRLKKQDPRIISSMVPRSPIRENFRTIRNSISFATLDNPPKSIVLTSSIEGEGKTFSTVNLAISLANKGKKVLIIDGDLRRPATHYLLNQSNKSGLTNFLVGEIELKNIQMVTGIDGLHLIPSGPIPPDPARLVESKKMRQLVKDMEGIYDHVIIDTPPILAANDAIFFGGWADGLILVLASGKTSRRHFQEVVELVKQANINIIGAVLNMVIREGSQYYYHREYYK